LLSNPGLECDALDEVCGASRRVVGVVGDTYIPKQSQHLTILRSHGLILCGNSPGNFAGKEGLSALRASCRTADPRTLFLGTIRIQTRGNKSGLGRRGQKKGGWREGSVMLCKSREFFALRCNDDVIGLCWWGIRVSKVIHRYQGQLPTCPDANCDTWVVGVITFV
jgi:hypothetical protein